jgi:hypothetical protein
MILAAVQYSVAVIRDLIVLARADVVHPNRPRPADDDLRLIDPVEPPVLLKVPSRSARLGRPHDLP